MNIIELQVEGMSCSSCVKHVTQALQPLPGVSGVEVDFQSGRVRVRGELVQGVASLGRRWLLAASMASAGVLMVTAPCVAWAQTSLDATVTQSSSEQGVTVKVTAKSVGLPGRQWEFAVVLDTHSADLSDDMGQSATLTTDDGRTFKPTGWLGAPPGGHHREGVLAFDVPAPQPGAIELRIDRPGESAPRIFRWKL